MPAYMSEGLPAIIRIQHYSYGHYPNPPIGVERLSAQRRTATWPIHLSRPPDLYIGIADGMSSRCIGGCHGFPCFELSTVAADLVDVFEDSAVGPPATKGPITARHIALIHTEVYF